MSCSRWRRRVVLLSSMLVLLGGTAAYAQNPHFINNHSKAAIDPETGQLIVSWREAGLGKSQNIDYEVSADGFVTYQCLNSGGNCPQAANKQSVAGPVFETGTFNSGQNGQITGSLTIDPPPVPAFCPSGQTEVVAEVSYSNIQITDLTNGITSFPRPLALSVVIFTCS